MLGSILNFVGGFLDNQAAADRQDSANQFSAQQFATRYQTTVKDMQAAGLNPALAYQQGGGSPASGAVSSPGNNFSQMGTAVAQMDLLKAQTRKTNAEAVVTEGFGLEQAKADLDRTLASIGLTAQQTAKVTAETTNIVQTLNNIKSEDERLKRAAAMLWEQGNLYFQQQLTESQRWELVKQQAKLVISQTGLNNLDLDAAKALGNIGREAGQLKPIVDILTQLLQSSRPRGGGITINK